MNGFLHTSGTAYISIIWSEVMKHNNFSSCASNSACEPVSSMVPEVSLSRVRSAFILVLLSLYLRDEDTRGRRDVERRGKGKGSCEKMFWLLIFLRKKGPVVIDIYINFNSTFSHAWCRTIEKKMQPRIFPVILDHNGVSQWYITKVFPIYHIPHRTRLYRSTKDKVKLANTSD